MKNGLPQGWTTAPLDALCHKLRGVSYKRDEASSTRKDGYLPILRANNIEEDRLTFDELVWVPANRVNDQQKLRKGDIVVAMSSGSKNIVGKTAQASTNWDGAFGAFCGILRPVEELHKQFLGLFLRTREYRFQISELSAGSNINNLKNEHFAAIDVPLAPLNEQKRIVAKLEKVLSAVEDSQKRLAKIPVLLKHFRQSVVAAACAGRLTSDWREKNSDVESASEIIKRLETKEPEQYLDIFEKTSDKSLPESWVWVRLGKLGNLSGGGTPSKSQPRFWEGKIPWVSPKDMKRDRIFDAADHITIEAINSSSTKWIRKGSILFVVRGMILLHTLPTAITDVDVTMNQDMKALTPEFPEMAEYLFVASKHIAQAILFEVKEATHGTLRVDTPLLLNWAVPLPPLPEQKEIVRRVEALFALADKIETRYKKAQTQVDKLTPSILAKAFRGELVPQDPNDEPASVLLERIKKQKVKK